MQITRTSPNYNQSYKQPGIKNPSFQMDVRTTGVLEHLRSNNLLSVNVQDFFSMVKRKALQIPPINTKCYIDYNHTDNEFIVNNAPYKMKHNDPIIINKIRDILHDKAKFETLEEKREQIHFYENLENKLLFHSLAENI